MGPAGSALPEARFSPVGMACFRAAFPIELIGRLSKEKRGKKKNELSSFPGWSSVATHKRGGVVVIRRFFVGGRRFLVLGGIDSGGKRYSQKQR